MGDGLMQWDEYKALSQRFDHFSRFALEETCRLVGPGPLGDLIAGILEREPVPKPVDHTGGRETDQLLVDLEIDEVQCIIDRLTLLANHESKGREHHLRVVWTEYAATLRT